MPTDRLHYLVEQLLSRILEYYVERNGLDASIISNIAIRWDKFHKTVGADPDIALQTPALSDDSASLLLWKKNVHPPKIVVEIVSKETAEKDYLDKPAMYEAAGVNEYWVLDLKKLGPCVDGAGLVVDKRTLKSKKAPKVFGPYFLQVYSRDQQGKLVRTFAGDGPAFSHELNAWLVVLGRRVRLAEDEQGTRLWPTKEEHERAEKEHERAEKEHEREAKEAALKELADLKKKLGLALRAQLSSLGWRRILLTGSS